MGSKSTYFDEMFGYSDRPRKPYRAYNRWIKGEDIAGLQKKSIDAERLFRRTGITFNVYGKEQATERLIPFDLVPRVLSATEWTRLERGIKQRVSALPDFEF